MKLMKTFLIGTIVCGALIGTPALLQAAPSFDADVWPYFQAHCVSCHGEQKHEGEFRIDTLSRKVGFENSPQWAEVIERITRARCRRRV